MAVSGSKVYVAWENNTFGTSEIFFRASTNNGSTFGPVINLSANSGSSADPHVAASGNNVYVVWTDDSDGDNDIYIRVSSNNGTSFSPFVNLSADNRDSLYADIVAPGANVYVAWQNDQTGSGTPPDILLRVSTNSGSNFAASVNVSSNTGRSRTPKLAVSGSNVYVAWQDDFNVAQDEIFFRVSTNNGATFTAATINLSNTSGPSFHHSIAASGTNVYVAWKDGDEVTLLFDTLIKVSINSGGNFGTATNLSNSGLSDSTLPPGLAAIGSNVHIVWNDAAPGFDEIWFSFSSNGGTNFSAKSNLSDNAGKSLNPQLVASGSNVYVAWEDDTGTATTDIFFKGSSDSGASFNQFANLSANNGNSYNLQLAATVSNVYPVWQDDTPGNLDILFKPGTTAAPVTHDMAVTGLTATRDFAYNNVASNPVNITVTVANLGSVSETFTVTAKAGTTTIGSQSVTVPAGGTLSVVFSWHPELLARGTYQLTAQASTVAGETNTGNNNFTDGSFTVRLEGDVTNDCAVNVDDLARVGGQFGKVSTDPGFDTNADLNNDGAINVDDLAAVGSNFGTLC